MMQNPGLRAIAEYVPTGAARYDGIPFIEALPRAPTSKTEFTRRVANWPAEPTGATRNLPEIVRLFELSTIKEIVVPAPEFGLTGALLSMLQREPYVARDPRMPSDMARRTAISSSQSPHFRQQALKHKSTAVGHVVMGVTGMGKSTYVEAEFFSTPQVIEHRLQTPSGLLQAIQVPYLFLRCPHDGTLKSLCLQFFSEVDGLIGSNYLREARRIGGIAPMIMHMHTVAITISLGALIIDEVHNLRSSHGTTAELMLNLFGEILEKVGVSLVIVATPALEPILRNGVRNIRKTTTVSESFFSPMDPDSTQLSWFFEKMWAYHYTKKKGLLTDDVKRAWYATSGGNRAFASLAFFLAQVDAIMGGREKVDEVAFERVRERRMAFLQPAIRALVSRRPAELQRFDDMIIKSEYDNLRKLMGIEEEATRPPQEMFDEEVEAALIESHRAKKEKRGGRKNAPAATRPRPKIVREDPFQPRSVTAQQR